MKHTIPLHSELAVGEARLNFADILNRVAYTRERIVVKKHHKPIMALISIEDLELLEAIEDIRDIKLARQRLKTLHREGVTSLKKLEKELILT